MWVFPVCGIKENKICQFQCETLNFSFVCQNGYFNVHVIYLKKCE